LKQFKEFEFLQATKDGRQLLTARGCEVRLWDFATGTPLSRPWLVQNEPSSAWFSPDGNTLLISAQSGSFPILRLWHWSTGKRIGPEYDDFNDIALSPEGQAAATYGKVWDRRPLQGEARLLVLWAQVLTQLEFDENDSVRKLDEVMWQQRRLELDQA